MSTVVREGTYGSYYTSAYNTSNPLNEEQQKVNATYIYKYLTDKGWSVNAIAGLLGNLQAESSINPGRWESERVYGTIDGRLVGVGLVQWTPYTKFTEWVRTYLNRGNDYNDLDNNLARIIYEVENNLQWITTSSYPLSFKEFTTSDLAPSYLGGAFVINYERPRDQSEAVQDYRGELADKWYTYITGGEVPPIDGDIPSEGGDTSEGIIKRHKYKFNLFCRKRYGYDKQRRF